MGAAYRLGLVGPTQVTTGACSAAYFVSSLDGTGREVPVLSATMINLTGKGAGVARVLSARDRFAAYRARR